VEAASSSRRPLYENAIGLLVKLTEQFAEARQAVVSMAQDSRSHVRFNAILCLGKSTPRALTLQLIRQCLRDKSARVRQKAADWAGRLRVREIVPDLEQAKSKESYAKARESIAFNLQLLRDGYILERNPDGSCDVSTFTNNGIAARWVSGSELKQRGIAAIVAELANDRF
jgi:hypothetical protein